MDSPLSLDQHNDQFDTYARHDYNLSALTADSRHNLEAAVSYDARDLIALREKEGVSIGIVTKEKEGSGALQVERESAAARGGMTIGMITVDSKRNIAAAASTNGVAFKIPGRVGDGSMLGAGAYVDGEVISMNFSFFLNTCKDICCLKIRVFHCEDGFHGWSMQVGAAVATGDGDLMMNFLPAFRAVQVDCSCLYRGTASADICVSGNYSG